MRLLRSRELRCWRPIADIAYQNKARGLKATLALSQAERSPSRKASYGPRSDPDRLRKVAFLRGKPWHA